MAGSDGSPRILLVDDEPDLLDGLRRQLRRQFDVVTAVGAANGLFALGKGASFEVIVSDFMMPGINGAQFLAAAKKAMPSATRMLLTGHTNLADAALTVNQGGVFRMLLKPVDQETMGAALNDCVAQHRLVVGERELLEQTLRGSVQALTEVLSLVSPAGFGRGTRMRRVASAILDIVEVEDRWAAEIAVQMSQLGVVSLPPAVADRLAAGAELSDAEQAMADRMIEVAEQLISPIPRLGPVAEAIRYSRKGFDGSGPPQDGTAGQSIPFGGRLLRLVEEHDELLARGVAPAVAIATLRSRAGRYDPVLLDALATVSAAAGGVRGVDLAELQCGMVLAAPVTSLSGVLLVGAGPEVTPGLLTRLRNFAELEDGVAEPVMVLDRPDADPSDPGTTG